MRPLMSIDNMDAGVQVEGEGRGTRLREKERERKREREKGDHGGQGSRGGRAGLRQPQASGVRITRWRRTAENTLERTR
jgi:hypothetical protein